MNLRRSATHLHRAAALAIGLLSREHNSILTEALRSPARVLRRSCPLRSALLRKAVMVQIRITASLLAAVLATGASAGEPEFKQFLAANCLDCHDKATKASGLVLEDLLS